MKLPYEIILKILLHTDDFNLVCEFGDDWIIKKMYVSKPKYDIWISTARYGNLITLKWLVMNTKSPESKIIVDTTKIAARNGHLEIIKFLHEHNSKGYTKEAMSLAALNGHLEIVKFLHENRTEGSDTSGMNYAAFNGHLEVVKWLHVNRTEGCTELAMDLAAMSGYLNVVEWLHENRTEGCSRWAIEMAAKMGHLKVVEWLYKNGESLKILHGAVLEAMNLAALNGQFECVKFLYEKIKNNEKVSVTEAINRAAQNGHLEIMQFLHDKTKEPYCTEAMIIAAECGQLKVVKFLYDNISKLENKDVVTAIEYAELDEYSDIAEFLKEKIKK